MKILRSCEMLLRTFQTRRCNKTASHNMKWRTHWYNTQPNTNKLIWLFHRPYEMQINRCATVLPVARYCLQSGQELRPEINRINVAAKVLTKININSKLQAKFEMFFFLVSDSLYLPWRPHYSEEVNACTTVRKKTILFFYLCTVHFYNVKILY